MKWMCFFMLGIATALVAAPVQFHSSPRQTSLLELYTSQGCSSCPPAEAWLSRLKTSAGLWHEFVPVAFHVDYWDNLGWKDPLADGQFTMRQQNYARHWSAPNVYTPEFVVNGREWHDWLGWRGAPTFTQASPGILEVQSNDGKHWVAHFTPTESNPEKFEISAALLASDLSFDVNAGENSGRHLNHDFAALSLVTHPLILQTNGWEGKFVIDPRPKGITGRLALAVWVTHTGKLEPVQATGGWLPTTNSP